MYEQANLQTASSARPAWLQIQDLAFSEDKDSFEVLTKLVSDAERTSIRLPVIRTALKGREFRDKEGKVWTVKKGDTIILDLVSPHGLRSTTCKANNMSSVSGKCRGNKICQSSRPPTTRCRVLEPHIECHRPIRRLRREAPGRDECHKYDQDYCSDEESAPRPRRARPSQGSQHRRVS